MRCSKSIAFCAGHRLKDHAGKCRHLHGHNYSATLTFEGPNDGPVGVVIDFADIKKHVSAWLDAWWDHAFILAADDAEAIKAISQVAGSPIFLMPYPPSAENLARYLIAEFGDFFSPIRLVEVRVEEAPGAWGIATA